MGNLFFKYYNYCMPFTTQDKNSDILLLLHAGHENSFVIEIKFKKSVMDIGKKFSELPFYKHKRHFSLFRR